MQTERQQTAGIFVQPLAAPGAATLARGRTRALGCCAGKLLLDLGALPSAPPPAPSHPVRPVGRTYRARQPPDKTAVLPGNGSARPSTHPAGPPHTVGAVCGAAYPCQHGRRFGHPGGGAVLMLPQGPAGQRSARLAPPRKKGKAKPCGRVAALLFFWRGCRTIFPAKVPGAEKRPCMVVAVFRPRGPPPPPGINRGGGVVAPRPCVGTTPSRAGGSAPCGALRAAAATISNGPHQASRALKARLANADMAGREMESCATCL